MITYWRPYWGNKQSSVIKLVLKESLKSSFYFKIIFIGCGYWKIVIIASRKSYYTRSNPDPKPVVIVDNPDRIGKKKKQTENLEAEISLIRVNSLPSELVSLQNIDFDLKFEHSLFKSKYESDLKTVVLDPGFVSFFNAKQKSIVVSSKS